VKKMAFADDVTIALREACDHAKHAAATENLNEVHEYGARARQTLESIKRNELDETVRQNIEQAIRHARNAELAVHADGGRLDAEKSRDLISGLLEAA
jgi:hypothetical protein